ncbi:MAG: hypothetical protein IT303_17770 [Dehalococcoidia bacterium]|nr:hypothetical protein [Dehalococcoidia bacterium]
MSDRQFYARVALTSGPAFVVAGYLTLFSIGLGLLVLAVVAAGAAAALHPTRLYAAVAAVTVCLAAVPWAAIALWAIGQPIG